MLKNTAPELVIELMVAFTQARRADLSAQIGRAVIDNCIYSDEDDVGYVHLRRPPPSPCFAQFPAPVAETLSFYPGINVDVDHDGHLYGVEFIARPDVASHLKAANAF